MDESNGVRQKGDAIPLITSVGPRLPELVFKVPVMKAWRFVARLFAPQNEK
jgi:hypothetical protein